MFLFIRAMSLIVTGNAHAGILASVAGILQDVSLSLTINTQSFSSFSQSPKSGPFNQNRLSLVSPKFNTAVTFTFVLGT